jgi:hypothetical protein
MLVAGMRMGERRAEAAQEQQQAQQKAQQQAYQQGQQAQAQKQTQQATAPTKDVTVELQKLADLHNSGVLSDEEFAAAKKKLLS